MRALDAVARLEALAARLDARAGALEARRDARCVFTHAYALMTRRLAAELPAADLDDAGWVVDLADAFAEKYFSALEAYDRGGEPPAAWQAVFATIGSRRTSVLEELAFGVYAHIVRDLPHTLREVGLTDAGGRSRLRDHHTVTAIVGRAIDDVQAAISERYGPYVRALDRIGHRYDEILTNYGIRLSRGMAWYNALRLDDPRSAASASGALEESTRVFVAQVMNPPLLSLRAFLRASRWFAALLRRWPKPT
ncbi:MAG TPA: DUF5995 family protein [Gaiellaceae bacterium]|nr:DUF5995 family protein [Gaiellaceae bacterium]